MRNEIMDAEDILKVIKNASKDVYKRQLFTLTEASAS